MESNYSMEDLLEIITVFSKMQIQLGGVSTAKFPPRQFVLQSLGADRTEEMDSCVVACATDLILQVCK